VRVAGCPACIDDHATVCARTLCNTAELHVLCAECTSCCRVQGELLLVGAWQLKEAPDVLHMLRWWRALLCSRPSPMCCHVVLCTSVGGCTRLCLLRQQRHTHHRPRSSHASGAGRRRRQGRGVPLLGLRPGASVVCGTAAAAAAGVLTLCVRQTTTPARSRAFRATPAPPSCWRRGAAGGVGAGTAPSGGCCHVCNLLP
jgi:hypothetical protein